MKAHDLLYIPRGLFHGKVSNTADFLPGAEIEIKAEIIGFELKDTAVVMFSNISEEYFRFLDARARGGNIISSVTGEPINHPTNVQGGYGYFNTHNPSIRQVVIKD